MKAVGAAAAATAAAAAGLFAEESSSEPRDPLHVQKRIGAPEHVRGKASGPLVAKEGEEN